MSAPSTQIQQQSYVPLFEGENYDFWCVRMRTLFISLDLWDLLEEGFEEPESIEDLSQAQEKILKEKQQRDASALGKNQQGVSNSIFPRIIGATKAKEALDILQNEFKGSSKVRISKLQDLRRDFENINLKENETMQEFSDRFTELVNQMKIYGDQIEDKKIVKKALISLPQKFHPIVFIIEEAKNLSTMTIQELMGSLKSFERKLLRRSEKSVESVFQSKLNFNQSNSSRGGRQGRGRRREGSAGRGQSIYD